MYMDGVHRRFFDIYSSNLDIESRAPTRMTNTPTTMYVENGQAKKKKKRSERKTKGWYRILSFCYLNNS